MRRVHFNSLPQAVRRRVTDALNGEAKPETLAEELIADKLPTLVALSATATTAFLLYLLVGWDFGVVGDGLEQGYVALAFYVGWTTVALGGLIYVLRRALLKRAYPFAAGRYLLPFQAIDATGPVLKVFPRSDITRVAFLDQPNPMAESGGLVVSYRSGGRHVYRFDDFTLAQEVFEKLQRYSELEHHAKEDGADELLEAFDPLVGMTDDDWAQAQRGGAPEGGDPRARAIPLFLRSTAIAAVVLGLGAGGYLWYARNVSSQEQAFANVRSMDRSQVYRDYLEHASLHADEVRDTLLPASQLREARSVTQLRAFLDEFGDTSQADEARLRLINHYDAAVARFEALAEGRERDVVPAVTRMVRHLQAHETTRVEVRFRPPSSDELSQVDALLETLGQGGAAGDDIRIAKVAPFFTPDRAAPRESAIARSLQGGFARVFDEDLVSLELGDRLPPSDAASGPPTETFAAPTLVVEYEIRPSGQFFGSDTDSALAYVGIAISFDVWLMVPETEPFLLRFSVEPPEQFSVNYTVHTDELGVAYGNSGPTAGSVYDIMALNAFDQLSAQILAAFFEAPDPAPSLDAIGALFGDDRSVSPATLRDAVGRGVETVGADL